ncbi:hypothetical protein OG400_19015 [Micromonospora ureilytica]|uniref:vWA-MoxR associated conflict system protein n=1 Tax=Micromonospora ureilytica TaxID=709868 RepID=UPI002E14F4C3|nr:hypothetical protein OG400_19015 [Micromonospora ureilytica]
MMQHLDELESAAAALHDEFMEPATGACEPGLPDGTALRYGALPAHEITQTVMAAARHAADADATLVLALLGHGFVPGRSNQLYFMGSESVNQDRASSVDVRGLLTNVVDNVRVNGVLTVIDTCVAAGGVPSMDEVLTGTRDGRTRVAMLLAASVGESAYSLKVSRELAALLRSGIAGAGDRLDIASVRHSLQMRVPQQTVARLEYDGDSAGTEGLWLAYNRLHHTMGSFTSMLGPIGIDELRDVLSALEPPASVSANIDLAGLAELGRLLETGSSVEHQHASRIIEVLRASVSTVEVLRRTMPEALSTPVLRKALGRLDAFGAPHSSDVSRLLTTEVDFVEHVALHRSGRNFPAERTLALFVVGLAYLVDKDPGVPALVHWAASVGATVPFNDALTDVAAAVTEDRLRLIVSLHASLSGTAWPEILDAWLLDAVGDVGREQFACTDSQQGVEAALRDAVGWAEELAFERNAKLHRIDIASPIGLLLRWRPEDVVFGRRLGTVYHVLSRWSGRLAPARGERWIITGVMRQLEQSQAENVGRNLDWLSTRDTSDLFRLKGLLIDGRYSYAVGTIEHPETADLLDLLLSHLPVVMWPHTGSTFSDSHRDRVERYWHRLPGEFHQAYCRHWTEDVVDPLVDVRAVWDDLDWLKFCASYRRVGGARRN